MTTTRMVEFDIDDLLIKYGYHKSIVEYAKKTYPEYKEYIDESCLLYTSRCV